MAEILAVCPRCAQCARARLLRREELAEEHAPLWLSAACCGEVLWALNAHHLELIADHVGADLRERRTGVLARTNRSIVSRLPRWIKLAKNRAEILKVLARLRRRT